MAIVLTAWPGTRVVLHLLLKICEVHELIKLLQLHEKRVNRLHVIQGFLSLVDRVLIRCFCLQRGSRVGHTATKGFSTSAAAAGKGKEIRRQEPDGDPHDL